MAQNEHDRRIDYIEFPATDLEQTKAFYTNAFDWKFTDFGPTYSSFEDGRLIHCRAGRRFCAPAISSSCRVGSISSRSCRD